MGRPSTLPNDVRIYIIQTWPDVADKNQTSFIENLKERFPCLKKHVSRQLYMAVHRLLQNEKMRPSDTQYSTQNDTDRNVKVNACFGVDIEHVKHQIWTATIGKHLESLTTLLTVSKEALEHIDLWGNCITLSRMKRDKNQVIYMEVCYGNSVEANDISNKFQVKSVKNRCINIISALDDWLVNGKLPDNLIPVSVSNGVGIDNFSSTLLHRINQNQNFPDGQMHFFHVLRKFYTKLSTTLTRKFTMILLEIITG